jgi:glycosyltransferase involved in cell wall biosynthesis
MDRYYSGVSQYTANLLTAILRQDSADSFQLFYNSFRNLDGRLGLWRRTNARLVGRHIPNKIFNYFLEKCLGRPRLDKILGGVDVFWSPHFNFSSFSPSVKKIVTVHDLSFWRYPYFFSGRKNFWHRALRIKKILRDATQIIAVSQSTKNDIIELAGVAPGKIAVIYSGNNLTKREVSGQEAREFLEPHGISGRFLLYLGNLEPRKNLVGLVAAYDKLRTDNPDLSDLRLVLAGAPGWKNRPLFRAVRRSPSRSDIIFLGYISQKEKEILYSRASVFVYPSYYEGFGFPPLEALAYDLPVVCSNTASLPEVVGEAAILINPFRFEEIAYAINEILRDETLRRRLIEKGRERIKLFSWDETARQYLEVFKRVAENTGMNNNNQPVETENKIRDRK